MIGALVLAVALPAVFLLLSPPTRWYLGILTEPVLHLDDDTISVMSSGGSRGGMALGEPQYTRVYRCYASDELTTEEILQKVRQTAKESGWGDLTREDIIGDEYLYEGSKKKQGVTVTIYAHPYVDDVAGRCALVILQGQAD